MEKHNVKNFSFDLFAGKHAKNQFKLWHFSREWRAGIIILSVLKIITWGISIYAGFYFLFSVSFPVIGSKFFTFITSLLLLIAIELLTWFFLSKFFKFLIKGIVATSIFSGIIALGIYFVSFHMSTNGLAMRQADKIDKSETIVDNSLLEINAIEQKYNTRIKDYHREIASIKANPAGWNNGRPTRLTANQLKDIKEFNLKIDGLEQQKRNDISNIKASQEKLLLVNKKERTSEANKYYNYVIAIMIAQFIFNGLLMFSWSRIYNENDKMQDLNEGIAQAENAIVSGFLQNALSRLFEVADKIQQNQLYSNPDNNIIDNTENSRPQIAGFSNNIGKTSKPVEKTSNIGFRQRNVAEKTSKSKIKTSNNRQQPENKTDSNSEVLGKLRTNDMLRYCVKKKSEGSLNLTIQQIVNQCNEKYWRYHEFKNMMITAKLIDEPKKYRNGK